MEKLTAKDLLNISELLKCRIPGITLTVMPSPLMPKGASVLMMHPDDMSDFKDIFEPKPSCKI